MRVAFVVREFPSVSQTFVLSQVVGLLQRGIDVTVFGVSPRDDVPIHGDARTADLKQRISYRASMPRDRPARDLARVAWLVRNALGGALAPVADSRSAREALRALPFHVRVASRPLIESQERFDIVHAHFGPLGALAAVSRHVHDGLRAPLVVSMHAYDITAFPQRYGKGIYRHLFSTAERILPISRRGEELLEELGCPRDKLTIHRMGIDTSRFTFGAEKAHPERELRLLSVGRLVEKKGFEHGMRAVASLREAHDVWYTIIGDGPLQEHLTSLAHDLELSPRMTFTGWKPHEEVVEAMRRSDVLLVPSVTASDGNEEGIPMVIMEAMAMGLPVVTTPTGGISELVEDGSTGFLASQKKPSAISDAVDRLSRMKTSEKKEMLLKARRAVEQKHDIDRLNDRLVSLYDEVARNSASVVSA